MVIPAIGVQALGCLPVLAGCLLVVLLVKIHGQLEVRVGQQSLRVLDRELFGEFIDRHDVRAVRAVFNPVVEPGDVAIVADGLPENFLLFGVGHFRGPHDAPLLVDPDARGHVDHVVQRADGVLRVIKRRECGLGAIVELACGCLAGRVLGRRDDLEILILQFLVDLLPTWQIEAATSPRGPGQQQHLLASEIG